MEGKSVERGTLPGGFLKTFRKKKGTGIGPSWPGYGTIRDPREEVLRRRPKKEHTDLE